MKVSLGAHQGVEKPSEKAAGANVPAGTAAFGDERGWDGDDVAVGMAALLARVAVEKRALRLTAARREMRETPREIIADEVSEEERWTTTGRDGEGNRKRTENSFFPALACLPAVQRSEIGRLPGHRHEKGK